MEGTAATNGFLQTRRARWLLIAALVFVLIGLLWWAYWFFHARFYQDTDDAYVAGDKAYDAAPLVQLLESNRCAVVIPSKADRAGQRPIDLHLYKERHLVECFFQRIKRFRRISMRFEKLARNFLAFLHLACALVWLV